MIFGSASAARQWLAPRPTRLGELQVRGAALVPASGQRPPGAPDGPVIGPVAGTGAAAGLAQGPAIAEPADLLAFGRRAGSADGGGSCPRERCGSHESSITVPAIIQAMR